METKIEITQGAEPLHVLLVGNNPIDMSRILEKLHKIPGKRIITEIAFDLKSILDRLMKFDPNFILIDDNIGKAELSNTIEALAQSNKTRNVPITVLKNSNYQESLGSSSILDYLLKTNLSSETLYSTLRNTLRFKKTQRYLYKAYQKGKDQIKALY